MPAIAAQAGTVVPAFFHGGFPGLRRGDVLRPPAETGVLTDARVLERVLPQLARHSGWAASRPDRVYAGDKAVAMLHAARYTVSPWQDGKPGAVYQVEPGGTIEADPDAPGTGECMCEYATITRVVAPAITRDIIRRSKLINPDVEPYLRLVHEAWEAGDTPAQLERKLLALRASRAARQVSLSAIRALGL